MGKIYVLYVHCTQYPHTTFLNLPVVVYTHVQAADVWLAVYLPSFVPLFAIDDGLSLYLWGV